VVPEKPETSDGADELSPEYIEERLSQLGYL